MSFKPPRIPITVKDGIKVKRVKVLLVISNLGCVSKLLGKLFNTHSWAASPSTEHRVSSGVGHLGDSNTNPWMRVVSWNTPCVRLTSAL